MSWNSRPFSPLPRDAALPPLSSSSSCHALTAALLWGTGWGLLRTGEDAQVPCGCCRVEATSTSIFKLSRSEVQQDTGGRLKSVPPKLSHQLGMRGGSGATPDVQDKNPHLPPMSCQPEKSGEGGAAAFPHRHNLSPSTVAAPHSPVGEPRQIAPALQHQRRVEPAVAETRRGEEAIRTCSSFTRAAASCPGAPNGRCSSGIPIPPLHNKCVFFSPLFTA